MSYYALAARNANEVVMLSHPFVEVLKLAGQLHCHHKFYSFGTHLRRRKQRLGASVAHLDQNGVK
jgi:hypothetical protein